VDSKKAVARVGNRRREGCTLGHPSAPSGFSKVVGGRETSVLGVGDEADSRELGSHHLDAAIGGGVIHDDDLGSQRALRIERRTQALLQKIADVPTDDDDGKINH
jgi:hypothetical protein